MHATKMAHQKKMQKGSRQGAISPSAEKCVHHIATKLHPTKCQQAVVLGCKLAFGG